MRYKIYNCTSRNEDIFIDIINTNIYGIFMRIICFNICIKNVKYLLQFNYISNNKYITTIHIYRYQIYFIIVNDKLL